MPEPDNKENKPKKAPWKEMTMEQRLLLTFVLMGVVLFFSQFLYNPAPKDTVQPVKPPTQQQAKLPPPPAEPGVPAAEPAGGEKKEAPAGQTSAQSAQQFTIETEVYRIVFHNQGAVVRSWLLKQYRDGTGKPLELVNPAAAAKTLYPFALLFEGQNPPTDINQALYAAQIAPDKLGIDFEYSNGATRVRKSFRFAKNSYLSQVTTSVSQNASEVPHLIAWRGGFGDLTVAAAASTQRAMYFNTSENKLIENEAKVAKEGPVTVSGPFSFAGVEDTYFAAVFLPRGGDAVKVQTFSDTVASAPNASEEPHVGAAVGGQAGNQFGLFVGPKDLDLLRRVDPKLVQVVDFGWFGFIARPLFLALNWMNNNFVHNYGWSIVIVTVLINFLLLPLKLTGMKSMRKMSALQPQVAAINEKYKSISIRDPRKAQQNQELMDLYKKHGVNPLGAGCMPLVLQIPFFFAFYKVLTVAIEMRGADWLWVSDLSQPETIPIRILPIAMIATQFFLQKMTPTATMDPTQQRMMLMMPLVMGFMFYGVSSGLVLYWLTGNIVSIVQQWFINRFMPAPVVQTPQPAAKKTSRK
jgi:YidC/Oxa1 family membrane protein insertase